MKKITVSIIIALMLLTGCAKDDPKPNNTNKISEIYSPVKGKVLAYAVVNKSSEKLVKITKDKKDYNPKSEEIIIINNNGFNLLLSQTKTIECGITKNNDKRCDSIFYISNTAYNIGSGIGTIITLPIFIIFEPSLIVTYNLFFSKNKFNSIISKNKLDIKRNELLLKFKQEEKEKLAKERFIQEKREKERFLQKKEKLLQEKRKKEKLAKEKEKVRKKLELEKKLRIKKHNKVCKDINKKIDKSDGTILIKLYNKLEKEHCN